MSTSDEQIMQAVASGQTRRLGELYQRYRDPIFGYLWNQTNGDRQLAEDVLQDTFERILKYKQSFRPESHSFKAWLFTIARNALVDRQKKQRPTMELNGYQTGSLRAESVTQLLDLEDTQAALQIAMKQLKPAQREMLDLAWKRQLKYREIARLTGSSESKVKVTIHRAVRQIRTTLKATQL